MNYNLEHAHTFCTNNKEQLLKDKVCGCFYCIEANALLGMTPNSLIPQEAQQEGISYDDLCEEIVNIAINKKHNKTAKNDKKIE